jgi:hypothetical protein
VITRERQYWCSDEHVSITDEKFSFTVNDNDEMQIEEEINRGANYIGTLSRNHGVGEIQYHGPYARSLPNVNFSGETKLIRLTNERAQYWWHANQNELPEWHDGCIVFAGDWKETDQEEGEQTKEGQWLFFVYP